MTRLLRYAEPYFWLILAAVMLLFGQAMCDLALPDYMTSLTKLLNTPGSATAEIMGIGGEMLACALASAGASNRASRRVFTRCGIRRRVAGS